MAIYVDALITVNFMMDFIMIRLASMLAGAYASAWRCSLGAFIGALSSLMVFIPSLSWVQLLFLKAVVSTAMIFASFFPLSLSKFLKLVTALFSVSFIISGFLLLAANSFMSDRMSVYRGILYLDIGLPAMLLSVTAAYLLVRLLSAIVRDRGPEGSSCRLTVCTKYGKRTVDAIIDTGCRATEPFSGEPVILCEIGLLYDILPPDFKNGTNFRLVPFATVNSTGMLRALRSEYALIDTGNGLYRCRNVFIALGQLGGCALINPAVLNNSEREEAFQ